MLKVDQETIPEILLNYGHNMPVLGMACAALPLPPFDQLISILINAIELGHCHFDTAACYGSEETLGRAIARAIELGLIESRDELFITSKLWCSACTQGNIKVEMNVNWQQRKLIPFCKEKGIHVIAWSPLGGSGAAWGSNAVMENSILKDLAASKSKTFAQVAIRWIYQQGGASVIVKSFNKERMKQNLQIFDWELSPQELDQILYNKRIFYPSKWAI